MSHWNHRVMRREYKSGGEVEVIDEIYEVYYTDSGEVDGWTDEPVGPSHYVGIDDGTLLDSVKRFEHATALPTLDYETGKEIDMSKSITELAKEHKKQSRTFVNPPKSPEKPSLGDLLQETITELENARIKGAEAQASAELEKIRKERKKRQKFVKDIKDTIVKAIESGKVPLYKVSVGDKKSWVEAAEKGKAEFQDLWSNLIQELGQEKLRLKVTLGHDGVGMEEWLNITVEPRPHKITYRGGIYQPTSDEMEMDPRPVRDPRIIED